MPTSAAFSILAAETRPAGASSVGQLVIATSAAVVLTGLLIGLGAGHRTGRLAVLGRAAEWVARSPFGKGQPAWSALPLLVALVSLITALLGMYWDIALHIGVGRDEGPLANAAHYPIMFGLFGIFAAGALACVLPMNERPGPASVRLLEGWHAPVGGLLLAGAGMYALLGFPLDDVWHRIFGQDVTLWGPTHLMLIGGAGLSLVGMAVLYREGRLSFLEQASQPPDEVTPDRAWLRRVLGQRSAIMGGLLIGLSVFQAEFDFGVPQYRMVFQPLLIATAGAVALVTARLWVGAGGAIAAVLFYLVIRGGVGVAVGTSLGELFPSVPLYLAEAVLVELVALVLIKRPLALGAVSGLLIGTVGFAAEYVWTQIAFELPWTADIVVEGLLMAVVGGVAGGLFGALIAMGLWGRMPAPSVRRPIFALGLLALGIAVANGLAITVPKDVSASVVLEQDTGSGDNREAEAVITLDPADAVDEPAWLSITSWQGGGSGLHVDRLERVDAATFRTNEPMPLGGTWKTMVRFHDGRQLGAIPVFLPEDLALKEPEIPASARFERPVVKETDILQRELKDDVPGWLWPVAGAVVLACTLALVVALGWGVSRLSEATPPELAEDGA